jgi:hypothetical protein
MEKFDSEITEITATIEQLEFLNGPPSIPALKAADFLGNQKYIDEWVANWLLSMDFDILQLPLCIEESIYCDKKLRNIYQFSCQNAVMRNDLNWLEQHLVIPLSSRIWNFVDFSTVRNDLFDFIWERVVVQASLADFVAGSKNMHIWKKFTQKYYIDYCAEIAIKQQWVEGVKHCIEEGCQIEPLIKDSIKSGRLFQIILLYNPKCTKEDYQEFILQKMLGRIEDIPIVEEYFYCQGFRANEFEHNLEF